MGHGQLGSYRQRLHFRKAIAAEVPWYMALVAWWVWSRAQWAARAARIGKSSSIL